MPLDFAFNAITGDFPLDATGASWAMVEDASTSVLHQLLCHYDRSWIDPELGSRLFDRNLFTGAPASDVLAEVARAMGVLVAEGLIADLVVTAVEPQPGRVNVRTQYRVVATGQLVDEAMPVADLLNMIGGS